MIIGAVSCQLQFRGNKLCFMRSVIDKYSWIPTGSYFVVVPHDCTLEDKIYPYIFQVN